MRTLNITETQMTAGGCGPGMFNGLFEALAVLFGIGVASTFVVGVASVYAFQYGKDIYNN